MVSLRLCSAPRVLLAGCAVLAAPAATRARQPAGVATTEQFSLEELLARARREYPGTEAARYALAAAEHRLTSQRWSWLPSFELQGLVAPTPEIHCLRQLPGGSLVRDGTGASCLQTTAANVNQFNINGAMARFDLRARTSVYTFGKRSARVWAARARVDERRAQLSIARGDLELNVARAYWGIKLARAILDALREGKEYLLRAQARIEQQLDSGEGDATVTDELRLKTSAAELAARRVQVEKLERIAHHSLAVLVKVDARKLDVDHRALAQVERRLSPLAYYVRTSRLRRPELVLARARARRGRARAAEQRAQLMPDFALTLHVGYGVAPAIDDPQNGLFNDPFNFFVGTFGLSLSWSFDAMKPLGRYSEARSAASRWRGRARMAQRSGTVEIERRYHAIEAASKRAAEAREGQRAARKWLTENARKFATGKTSPRELTDALVAYLRLRVMFLQSVFDVNVGWARLDRATGPA